MPCEHAIDCCECAMNCCNFAKVSIEGTQPFGYK